MSDNTYQHSSDPATDALRWVKVRRAIATKNETFGNMIANNADEIMGNPDATPDQKEKALDDIVDAAIRELNL